MKVGDRIKVYHRVRHNLERCSFGARHMVNTYEVKFLEIVRIQPENIPYLHYTHDGIGDVYYAKDYQGREYRKEPHWDGPRATGWIRKNDCRFFTQHPTLGFARDLTGRGFIL